MEETFVTSLTFKDDLDANDKGQPGKVELLISCSELANLDSFSKTDPMCVLLVKQFGQWKEYGRTEAVIDTNNPKFTETFVVDYDSEINLQLMFSVYDVDSRSTDLQKHDHVGSVEVTLDSLIKSDKTINTSSKSLRAPGDPQSRGLINITTEFIKETRSRLQLHIGAAKLDKIGFLSTKKTDTYLELSRSVNSVEYHPIYRTEVFHKSQDPRWRPFDISIQKVCNSDPDRSIQFSCWHVNNSERVLIGHAITTIKQMTSSLSANKTCLVLPILEPNKARKKSYRSSGDLKFMLCKLDMAYSVLDYVRGGCCLKYTLAVDFTSSNGDQKEPGSLHYVSNSKDNQYQEAIKTIGSMLSHYDTQQDFAVYGFGAKLNPKKKIRDCFPLTGKDDKTCVHGIKGILDAYNKLVPKLKFGGPSKLAPVLHTAIDLVKKTSLSQQNQIYHVLMIITDGVVNDIDATLQAIVETNRLPMSIVIVGIGPADFSAMEQLQTCVENLVSNKSLKNGKYVGRENLHFTALRKLKYITGANQAIAKEALAKISTQMVEYLKSHKIAPNRPLLQRTDPTGGWVSENLTLDKGDDDALILPKGGLQQRGRSVKGRRQSVCFKNRTPSCRGTTTTSSTLPTCPTCGSTIESGTDSFLDSGINTYL